MVIAYCYSMNNELFKLFAPIYYVSGDSSITYKVNFLGGVSGPIAKKV